MLLFLIEYNIKNSKTLIDNANTHRYEMVCNDLTIVEC